MEERVVIHSTFVIERSYGATPERVFGAFADASRKRRWFVESGGHEVEHYELDFRAGGAECARFRFKAGTPVAGMECISDTIYLDIVANRRVVFASSMKVGGRCISACLATVELLPSETGTELIFTHQGAFFEGADGPVMREAGWHKLLEQLAEELRR